MLGLLSRCSHVNCLYDCQSDIVGIPRGDLQWWILSSPVKHLAQREQGRRRWYSSPRGFHCGMLVASVISGCLLHFCGASKGGQVLTMKSTAFLHGVSPGSQGSQSPLGNIDMLTPCSESSFSLLSHSFPLELSSIAN